MKKKTIAFTLAEVLITLTIIGVIAALTIPNLMRSYGKHVTVTKVQKAYNILSRAAANMKINTGLDKLEDTDWGNLSTKDFLDRFVETAGIKGAEVYADTNWFRPKPLYCETQTCTGTDGMAFQGIIITPDGFLFSPAFNNGDEVKNRIMVFVGTEYKIKDGTKARPGDMTRLWQYKNGRNAFFFIINEDFKLEPIGDGGWGTLSKNMKTRSAYSYCDDAKTRNGNSCAGRMLLDGWKMNY